MPNATTTQAGRPVPRTGEYEHRVLTVGRDVSRGDLRRMLLDEAEQGRWELARTILYVGGARTVWLRRRIIRARSTLDAF